MGDSTVVSELNRNKIELFYMSLIDPAQMMVTVMGDVDVQKVVSSLGRDLGRLKKKKLDVRVPELPQFPSHLKSKTSRLSIPYDIGVVVILYDGISLVQMRDQLKMDLLDGVLSGMRYPSGRLHPLLRGKGLVYVVHAMHVPLVDGGYFMIYALTSKSKVDTVAKLILNEVKSLQTDLISPVEFDQSLSQLSFYYMDQVSSWESRSLVMTVGELYQDGFQSYWNRKDMINQLRLSDVREMARKHLKYPQVYIFR